MPGDYTGKFVLDCARERDKVLHYANAMARAIETYTRTPKIVRGEQYRAMVTAWQDYTREVSNVPVIVREEARDEWRSS